MQIKKICILGGAGFVGRVLANRLARDGYQLRVLTRDREKNREDLILLPGLELIEANIHDTEHLKSCFTGCDAVINLVGILNERGNKGKGFHHAHVTLTESVITASRAVGIKQLLQMSSLNADAVNGSSHYLRSKGEAEDKVHSAEGIHATSFRPSVIFGPDDSFFNRFAGLLKLTPLCFPLACANTRFAPVYVGDVADAISHCICNPDSYGRRYELCGPDSYTFKELVHYTARCIGARRLIVPLPDFLSRWQARTFDLFGFVFFTLGMEKPFSMDNYLSTQTDSVCHRNDLKELGVKPTAMDTIVPGYLSNEPESGPYYQYRKLARRN